MDGNADTNKSPPGTQVKKENDEEIKEFAETAMNELLGWYGYERLELRRWAASRAKDASSPEQANEQRNKDECSWCNKSIVNDSGALQQAGAAFCSELCFSQSRRANFKRAKTCDWCRHVRHTVAYVDFQDGATQLQFCSDKCLNQYKMHIFCRETQAHLDLNPHLVTASSSSNLITPELWLKHCKSRSTSPTSEISGSPRSENIPHKPEKADQQKNQCSKSPLPLITVTPTSKLMKQKRSEEIPTMSKAETKKDTRNNKINIRKRRISKCSATVTSQTVRQRTVTPKAQDLRICSASEGSSPTSTITNVTHSPPQPLSQIPVQPPPFNNSMFGMPPPIFMENHDIRPPNMFPPRMGYTARPGISVHHERPRLSPPINLLPPLGQIPPVTVLVPYPVVLPIPIPIPIPIPLTSFLQAHSASKVKTEPINGETDEPLDFSMNNNKRNYDDPTANIEFNIEGNEDKIEDEPVNTVTKHTDEKERIDTSENEAGNPEQTLPKFKITRISNKMAKIVAKGKESSESTRPLRKRRRLVEMVTDDEPLIPKTRKIVQV